MIGFEFEICKIVTFIEDVKINDEIILNKTVYALDKPIKKGTKLRAVGRDYVENRIIVLYEHGWRDIFLADGLYIHRKYRGKGHRFFAVHIDDIEGRNPRRWKV